MHICTTHECMHAYFHGRTRMRACMDACTRVCMHTCMGARAWTHICMCKYTHVCMSTHVCIPTHARTYACMYSCTHTCMCRYTVLTWGWCNKCFLGAQKDALLNIFLQCVKPIADILYTIVIMLTFSYYLWTTGPF